MEEDQLLATFWQHIEELRRTVIGMLVVIMLAVIISLLYYQPLLSLFEAPLHKAIPTQSHLEISQQIHNPSSEIVYYSTGTGQIAIPPGSSVTISQPQNHSKLVMLSPLEGVTTTLKICFWCGLVLSSPIWLLILLRFVAPGLNHSSRQLIPAFLILSLGAIGLGMLFAYWITLPLANNYLYTFNHEIGLNLWSLSHYFDYTVLLLLANGLAAELGLVLFFLVHLGIFSAETLKAKRRHMIVMAFIIAALLTPPDVLTQFLLAVPLILIYEATIVYARIKQ